MMKQKLLLQGTMSFSLLSLLNPLNMREHAAHHELREGGQNVSHMTCHPPESGMTTADFFVLDVLRGWRLLQATSLNREEWRDILSATNNMLDFDSTSNALQVLWNEQLMQPRSSHHHRPQAYLSWVEEDNSWAWNDDSCMVG